MTDTMLLIPHIRVQNANALSSPYTIGFPAMTAWLGAAHALQRKLNEQNIPASFDAVGIVSHQFDLQTYKGPGDFERSIVGTANPLDKEGKRPAFIEEARCHLEVSLIIQCSNIEKLHEIEILRQIEHCLNSGMKIAGGDILDFQAPDFYRDFKTLRRQLMPGYALIERRELVADSMECGQDAIDALLDYLCIHHECEQVNDEIRWKSSRKPTGNEGQRGWIVPIATGFQGISEPDKALNQRDPDTPHRFAEAVVTLGEFKMAYRLAHLGELVWHYNYDAENNLYLCRQTQTNSQTLLTEDGF